LNSSQIFADLGHGIGNAVIQAAALIGCEARGIELNEGRFKLSQKFHDYMCELMNIKASMLG
jgi:cyclopropane fatty-acyl-phospholipid synthase-like methyltransferase